MAVTTLYVVRIVALLTIMIAAMTGMTVNAQENEPVHLKSRDGTVSIKGQLLGFELDVYIVDVPGKGIVKVEGSQVECISGPCPSGDGSAANTAAAPEVYDPKFGIYGARTVGDVLMPNLLRGYAQSVGALFKIEGTEEASERIVTLTDPDGRVRAEIVLQAKGSASAFQALADGVAAIGMTDRRMDDADLEVLAIAEIPELRDTPNEVVLGVDGIVFITHPDNPVRDLSAEDIARIYSGEVTSWLELGGGDVPIAVHSFGTDSDDRAFLVGALVTPNGRAENDNITRWNTSQEIVDAVMGYPGSIGFVPRWQAPSNGVNLIAIRETCGLLSSPTDFQIKSEGYALSRRIYAYTPAADTHPEAKAFLAWAQSDAAQPWIKKSNFVDAELERMQLPDMGMMLIHTVASEPDFDPGLYVEMMRALRTAERLSISFRFTTGSSTLDVESERNLSRLAKRIEDGELNGFEVLLIGFADSIGEQQKNTELAQERADTVRAILAGALSNETIDRIRLDTLSFGELLPMSCNSSEVGRARNRRVEVWIRNPNKRVTGR